MQLTLEQARQITTDIKQSSEHLCKLFLRAYQGQAWIALGYDSWREYIWQEFDVSQSHAYRLLDQARIIDAF